METLFGFVVSDALVNVGSAEFQYAIDEPREVMGHSGNRLGHSQAASEMAKLGTQGALTHESDSMRQCAKRSLR
jgi:hypothetical protein